MKKALAVSLFLTACLLGISTPVYAAEGAQWVDVSTIEFREKNFFDRAPYDPTRHAEVESGNNCSNDKIEYSEDRSSGTAELYTRDEFGKCHKQVVDITFSNPNAGFRIGYRLSPTEVQIYRGSGGQNARPSRLETYRATQNSPNRYFFVEEDGILSEAVYVDISSSGDVKPNYGGWMGEKEDNNYGLIGIRDYESRFSIGPNPAPTEVTDAAGGGTGENRSCESEGLDLGWILCPVLRMADIVIEQLDQTIYSTLTIPDEYTKDTADPDEPVDRLETTWARIRNIAYAILVPMMLVMVISTALGFEFVSAYTFKRALPRMAAAVIFIALSWDITMFMVEFVNNVGKGVGGLITSAFGIDMSYSLTDAMTPPEDALARAGGNIGAGFAGLVMVGAGFAFGSIGIIISYAFVAILALLIAFVLLSLRQMLVLFLMLLAPLAILAWIFPGNDKFWKLWWGTFSKLLLLFPLIALMIASGKSFASVVQDVESSMIGTFIKLAAYVGPYFFIPAAFKFAGGVFATVAGMAQDRERGLFDRNKKYRQEKMAKNWSDFKKGDRSWRPASFNNLGRRIDAGAKGGFGYGRRGRAAMDIRGRANSAEAMKDPLMNQLQFDDDGILAMALSGGSRDGARTALVDYRNRLRAAGKTSEAAKWTDERIEKAVQTAGSVGYSRSNATAAIDMMARNKSFSLTGGAEGIETMLDATNRLAGGNQQMADNLMGSFEFNSRQAGRFDLGMHDYKAGTADMDGAWSKATLGQHAQGTGPSLQSFADHHLDRLQHGNQVQRRKAAIALMEMQNMLPNATAGNQEIINKTMFRLRDHAANLSGIDFNAGTNIESQLAAVATSGPVGQSAVDYHGNPLTGEAIRGMARVYDRDTPSYERAPGEEAGGAAPTQTPGQPSP